jgi:hypothetical protein
MASYQAIAAASAAIRGLISERYPRKISDQQPELPALKVELYQAKDIDKGLDGNGIAIFLWRVAINVQRRARGPRTDMFGNRFKPSLPIDLSFLIIPHATSAEVQLRILGWVMRALEDAGPLTATQLNHYLAETNVFAPDEEVELVCDPLSVADQLTLWDRIKKHPMGVNYLMRMMLIDSSQMITENGPVVERVFQTGEAENA